MKIAIILCAEGALLLIGLGVDRLDHLIPTWAIFTTAGVLMVLIPFFAYESWRNAFLRVVTGRRRVVSLANNDTQSAPDELWRVSPGAGRVVARAILDASSLREARAIFDAHRATPNPQDSEWAAYALTKRMDDAGEEIMSFAYDLAQEGIDIAASLEAIEAELGNGSRP